MMNMYAQGSLLWSQGFPDSSPGRDSAYSAGGPTSIPGSGRPPGEGVGYPLQHPWASLLAQLGNESACNVGDLGVIPWLGRYPGGGEHGNLLQYSCLENPHGQRSLAGYSPRGCKESDMTEQLNTQDL